MAPEITEITEVRFRVPGSQEPLRVRAFTPRTDTDYISTQGITKKDFGFLSSTSSGGIAEDKFYVGTAVVKDFQQGNDLWVQNSRNAPVVVVQLEDK